MQPHKCGTNAGTNQYILPKIASQINKDCYGNGRESTSIYLLAKEFYSDRVEEKYL